MQKLEILEQFVKKYSNKINPELSSIKYCQTESTASVEMYFINSINPIVINLDFIGGEIVKDEDGNDSDILPMFNPDADIVDNAKCLIELDDMGLLMFLDNIFTEEAGKELYPEYVITNKT